LLVRISATRLLLGITLHHIVADGWAVGIFTRELLAAYEALTKGAEPGLLPLSFQYADFAAWESEWVRSDAARRQLDQWRERLSGVRVMDLPADFPRPRVQTFRGGSCSGELSAEVNRRLREFSRAEGATPFMTLLSGFALLLHRLSGLDDVPLGVPVAGRGRRGTEQLIGMFVNTIVLRQDHSGDPSFAQLVRNARTQALEGYSNAEAPFDHVVDAVRAPRDAGRTPLFQVLVNTLDFNAGSRFSLPRLEIDMKVTEMAASKFDMTLYLGLEEDTTRLMLAYNADLFTAERMQELLAQFEAVLGQVLRDSQMRVSQISLTTPRSAAVLPDPIRPLGGRVAESVPGGLARRMAHAHARVALTGKGERWTYEALEAQANRLAHQLLRGGLKRQDVVAIYAHREPLMICAMLGVLKAGGAFAILDPTYPGARLSACWRAAQPRSVILLDGAGEPAAALQVEIAALAPELRIHLSAVTVQLGASALPSHDPALPIDPDELAYVAFTSGTTGGVKAILGSHGPVTHFLDWQARAFALDADDRFGMLSGLSHDPLLRDVLAPLWAGASLHVPDPAKIAEPGWLAQWIAREKLSVVHLTPALAQLLTAGPDHRMDSLRWIFVGGDVLTAAGVDALRRVAPNATCVNLYGATETPQAMGYYLVPHSGETRGRVPVGRGIDDVQLLVLNSRDALAGVGEPGEIVVRTPYLALGYRGDAELTRERFTASPFASDPDDRVYRTGDFGRYLPDGNVEFCGRGDGQTKLRGFRLELGEIEAVLAEHPEVRQAAVHLWRVKADDVRIVACCVPAKAGVLAPVSLRKHMRARLPEYMVPQYFVPMEEIPLTPNGKVDRRKLPTPAASEGHLQRHEAPADPVEAAIAEVWTHLIGPARPIGRADKFFEMGGHSLLALRALRQMERQLGVKIDLRVLFQESLAEIATRCRLRRVAHA
jgi:amino acid adenylation domain-containing protein